MVKLITVIKSEKPGKKWKAVFETENGRKKTTHFGQASADDYTITKDKEQRERYRARHRKDLETGDPTRAGFLSYWLLWSEQSIGEAIKKYKERFNL